MAVAGLFRALRSEEEAVSPRRGFESPQAPSSRMSKMEINLHRLLTRCEAAAAAAASDEKLIQDPKFHTFIAVLRNQLAALSGEQALNDQRSQETALVSTDRLDGYRFRVDVLASRLAGHVQPPLWAPLASACVGTAAVGSKEDAETTTEGFGVVSPQRQSDAASGVLELPSHSLRRRRRFAAELSSPGSDGGLPQPFRSPDGLLRSTGSSGTPDSLSLSGSARALLEQQRDIQEDLTESMLGLAKRLKANSLAMGEKVRGTEKLIDGATVSVENNLVQTTKAKMRTGEAIVQGWCTGCLTWIVIFTLLFIFMGMILFMKIT